MHGPARLPNTLGALALVFSVGEAAAQEYRGTEDQRMACTPDVFRFCWSEIPNVSQIVACLIREKPRLSEACRAVFEPPRQATHLRHRPRHHAAEDAR
jgi:hypothetical protein